MERYSFTFCAIRCLFIRPLNIRFTITAEMQGDQESIFDVVEWFEGKVDGRDLHLVMNAYPTNENLIELFEGVAAINGVRVGDVNVHSVAV